MNNMSIDLDRLYEIRTLLETRKTSIEDSSKVIDTCLQSYSDLMKIDELISPIENFRNSVKNNNSNLYVCIEKLLSFINEQINEYTLKTSQTETSIGDIGSRIDSLNLK